MKKRMVSLFVAACIGVSLLPCMTVQAGNMGKVGMAQTIAAGGIHTAAIMSDGSLWTWGENRFGQLGNGAYGYDEGKTTPVKVLDNVVAVSAGEWHTAAIKADGSLWSWGDNDDGQLGDGTNENKSTPIKIMENVSVVSVGNNHTAVIKADGSLWTWGDNRYGQLGDGTTESKSTPIKIMENVSAISAGERHAAAVTVDGSLWTWGENGNGQLGDGTTEDKLTPVKVLDNVVAVSAGGWHSAAIKADGSLWTWGSLSGGSLGNGKDEGSTTPVKVLENVSAVSLGGGHTAAIKTDGSLWTWGGNGYGQLGNGTKDYKLIPVQVMDNVMAVSAGGNHTSIITADGSLWACGWNGYGQLGNGKSAYGATEQTPVKIMDNVKLPGGTSFTPITTTNPPTSVPKRDDTTESTPPTATPKVTQAPKGGFDMTHDGWPFSNESVAFGYKRCEAHKHTKPACEPLPMEVWQEVYGPAVAKFSKKLQKGHWGGNCYGMSAYAAAIYDGVFSWNDGEVNNAGEVVRDGGLKYVKVPNDSLTKMIERAHITQFSEEFRDSTTEIKGKDADFFRRLIDEINNDKKTYIVGVKAFGKGHALVTDTVRGAEDVGDGWYKIYLYDPNSPYYERYEEDHLVPASTYQYWNMRWLNVNVNTGEWNMDMGVEKGDSDYVENGILGINRLLFGTSSMHSGHKDFKGYTIDSKNSVYANGMGFAMENAAGEKLIEVENGEVTYQSDDINVQYSMELAADVETDEFSGKIELGNEKLGKVTLGNAAFTLLNDKKVTQVSTDDNAECDIDGGKVEVTADKDADITVLSENMNSRDSFDAVTLTGTLEDGKKVTVNNKGNEDYDISTTSANKFDIEVSNTNGSVNLEDVDLNSWNEEVSAQVPETKTEKAEERAEESTADAVTDFGSPVSSWAKAEVEEAYKKELVPDVLVGKDLTLRVDRAEFASIAVKLYEELSENKAESGSNPFTDISDNECREDILKAYNLNITNGMTDTLFVPNELISREQVATMLTRAYKRSEFPDWTLANDSQFPLNFMGAEKFADDAEISDYAKESVYFMAKWGIINGVGENMFAPKNNVTLGDSYGYATREQAVVIALRSAKHL